MPNFWHIVIPFVGALTAVVVTPWANVNMRSAPTRDTAVHELGRIVFQSFRWVMIALSVWVLIREVIASAPVTRWAVFTIAFQIASLVVAVVMSVISRIMKSSAAVTVQMAGNIVATTDALVETNKTLGRHIALTGALVNATRPDRDAPKE
jgi:hypothetical protein